MSFKKLKKEFLRKGYNISSKQNGEYTVYNKSVYDGYFTNLELGKEYLDNLD